MALTRPLITVWLLEPEGRSVDDLLGITTQAVGNGSPGLRSPVERSLRLRLTSHDFGNGEFHRIYVLHVSGDAQIEDGIGPVDAPLDRCRLFAAPSWAKAAAAQASGLGEAPGAEGLVAMAQPRADGRPADLASGRPPCKALDVAVESTELRADHTGFEGSPPDDPAGFGDDRARNRGREPRTLGMVIAISRSADLDVAR